MTLTPGTTLGRYQILEPLGQGGMATVYKAFQPSLQREVALKVLRPGFAQDPEFRERFEREAIAIARLRHPHIVQVFDFEAAATGEYALAMEFLEGGTLKERITALAREGRRIEPVEAVRIIGEVADALAYAHDKGIVHRDVKPSNVMLGRRDWVVVTDFGIARILDATAYTQTGVGIGTPEYMAPEQGIGQHVDHRADIYALGVMAYELLVGRLPYRADTPMGVVMAHIKDPLPLPSSVNPAVGQGVERALLSALAKDPADRPESATAFTEALRAGLAADEAGLAATVMRGGGPAAAAPAGRRAPFGGRIIAGAAAGFAAVALAGVAFAGNVFGPPGSSTPPASTAPSAAALVAATPTAAPSAPAPTTTAPAPSPTTVSAPTLAPSVAPTAAPTRVVTAPPTAAPTAPPTPVPTAPPTPVATAPPTARSTPAFYELGQTAVLAWEGFNANELEVRVHEIVDPATPSDGEGAYVDPSERLVAVRMVITNKGPDVYDDYPADLAEIVDGQGRQYQADVSDPVAPGFGNLRIGRGVSVEGYISFAIPKTARVSGFIFAVDPFSDEVARWRVP